MKPYVPTAAPLTVQDLPNKQGKFKIVIIQTFAARPQNKKKIVPQVG